MGLHENDPVSGKEIIGVSRQRKYRALRTSFSGNFEVIFTFVAKTHSSEKRNTRLPRLLLLVKIMSMYILDNVLL